MFLLAAMFGAGRLDVAMSAPTAATCKTVFSGTEPQCSEYQVSSSSMANGQTFYICQCTKCNSGYHISGNRSEYKYYGSDYLHLPNGCAVGDGDSGGVTQTCPSGSSLCTQCKGPSVTINGKMYCGMWADTSSTKTCSGSPGASASFQMSKCCNSNGYAVGGVDGYFVQGCKPGFALNYAKTACVCDIGYYGTNSSCTRCPESDGINGFTAGIGKTQITDCYFPADFELTDSTGKYKYIQDCYSHPCAMKETLQCEQSVFFCLLQKILI